MLDWWVERWCPSLNAQVLMENQNPLLMETMKWKIQKFKKAAPSTSFYLGERGSMMSRFAVFFFRESSRPAFNSLPSRISLFVESGSMIL